MALLFSLFADNARALAAAQGKAIADRTAGELAYMYARLGRMSDLEALLKSVESRMFVGSATEKITGAREGLWKSRACASRTFGVSLNRTQASCCYECHPLTSGCPLTKFRAAGCALFQNESSDVVWSRQTDFSI